MNKAQLQALGFIQDAFNREECALCLEIKYTIHVVIGQYPSGNAITLAVCRHCIKEHGE